MLTSSTSSLLTFLIGGSILSSQCGVNCVFSFSFTPSTNAPSFSRPITTGLITSTSSNAVGTSRHMTNGIDFFAMDDDDEDDDEDDEKEVENAFNDVKKNTDTPPPSQPQQPRGPITSATGEDSEFEDHIPQMNIVTLVGRVGATPDPRYFDDGKVVVNVGLAVKRKYHPLERKALNIKYGEEETDWFTLEIWGRDAEYASKFVTKGARVGVTGSLIIDCWIDKATNEERSKPKILVRELDILESRAEAELRQNNSQQRQGGGGYTPQTQGGSSYGNNNQGQAFGGGGGSYDSEGGNGGGSSSGMGGFFD